MTVGEALGFACMEAESGEAALALLEEQPAHIILTDLVMPHMSGLEFLERVKKMLPRTEVAVMTGHGSVETAVQAMKLGAYDYIGKPFSPAGRTAAVSAPHGGQKSAWSRKINSCATASTRKRNFTESWAPPPKIQDVLRMISRLKDTRTPVLITGESGTGKELVARAIHFRGSFAERPFVAVDCGSLVPTLIESELFGYEKGAFTGAMKHETGLFQSANGGTIFLDEIGELPLEMQAKLLRVLQEKEVRPVGSNQKVKVDVRVIAATNRDLEAEYRNGTFRKDLYFRLNVVTVYLPSLRERRSDIPMLVHWFLDRYARGHRHADSRQRAMKSPCCNMTGRGMCANWRTASNERSRWGTIAPSTSAICRPPLRPTQPPPICPEDPWRFPPPIWRTSNVPPFRECSSRSKGTRPWPARMLGISRATLYRKLKRYNIGGRPEMTVARQALQ